MPRNKGRYRPILALLTLACLVAAPDLHAESQWAREARRFTGESDQVREEAIANLRKIPGLEKLLKKDLRGEERFLALDVISALKLRSLLPDLIELSKGDESGFSYQAINSLITPENEDRIRGIYRERILSERTAPAAKVVLLDTYGRMRALLRASEIDSLLSDSSTDVRSAALSYLRALLLRFGETRYVGLLAKAARDDSYQLRIQALYLASELPRPLLRSRDELLGSCRKDDDPRVRAVCAEFVTSSGKRS